MLSDKDAVATVAVKSLESARNFYEKTLGLTKVMENSEVLAFKSGRSTLFVYRSKYAGTNKATVVTWVADEIEEIVKTLKGACGGVGFRCERPDQARSALEAMLLADGPALCEAVVDPFEPPMPARVKMKQAVHMAESLAKGQPNRGRIALTLFRDKVHDLKGH